MGIGDIMEEGLVRCTHIDLFSGIGGFAYAAKQTWGGGLMKTFYFAITTGFAKKSLERISERIV